MSLGSDAALDPRSAGPFELGDRKPLCEGKARIETGVRRFARIWLGEGEDWDR